MGIEVLSHNTIDEILSQTYRHYLVGAFSDASLKDSKIEVGVSNYCEFTYDKPHYHTRATEYQYVLSGRSMLYDLTNNMLHLLQEGDFFIVRPNTNYAEKHMEGTKVLFFKNPGINDKVLIDVPKEILAWMENNEFDQ